jgi:hypothetical protein
VASVLNVVTVHWRSTQWIDVQLRYLEKNVDVPWRVFASLNGIDESMWDRFHFAADLDGTHAEKLNELAGIVGECSAPDDRLLFLDGDAFPVRPVGSWFEDLLSSDRLAAVRRDENLGDPQPHPCFCLTTVGFWDEIQGDWSAGEMWENEAGLTTDVGGKVLRALEERNQPWRPILRTNTKNIHRVWFGVYGHRIYHHGAGFRTRMSRVDELGDPEIYASVDPLGPANASAGIAEGRRDRADSSVAKIQRASKRDLRRLPADLRSRVRRRDAIRIERRRDRRLRSDEREAAQVFSWISDGDGDFYLRLDSDARD